MRRAELNQPHLRWMPEMSHPLTHMFMISTVYVGMPLGSGAVGPWFITISDLLHFSPHIRSGSIFPFPAPKPESFLFRTKSNSLYQINQTVANIIFIICQTKWQSSVLHGTPEIYIKTTKWHLRRKPLRDKILLLFWFIKIWSFQTNTQKLKSNFQVQLGRKANYSKG